MTGLPPSDPTHGPVPDDPTPPTASRPSPPQPTQPTQGPDLSVIIAARDAAATLGDQLAALADQRTDATWEVIVADNGSTDRTVAVARSFADRLPALHVVDASSRPGAGAARNIGATIATGRYLLFCDADDVVADGWLTALHAVARTHHLAAGRFDGTLLNRPRDLRSRALPQTDGLQRSTRLPALPHAGAGNLAVRADLFRAVGGFDPRVRFLEDTDLCWRLQLAGAPLTWAPDALVHVRLRGTLRTAARQGFDYGTGERWLTLRYRDLADALAADPAQPVAAPVPVPAPAPVPRPQPPDPTRGPGPARLLHRAIATARPLLSSRSLGDLGAWFWDVGWGLGYAYGRVDTPAPLTLADLAPRPASSEGASPPLAALSVPADDPTAAPSPTRPRTLDGPSSSPAPA